MHPTSKVNQQAVMISAGITLGRYMELINIKAAERQFGYDPKRRDQATFFYTIVRKFADLRIAAEFSKEEKCWPLHEFNSMEECIRIDIESIIKAETTQTIRPKILKVEGLLRSAQWKKENIPKEAFPWFGRIITTDIPLVRDFFEALKERLGYDLQIVGKNAPQLFNLI